MQPHRLLLFSALGWGGAFAQSQSSPASVQASVPACRARQLSIATDAREGCFDGMSHSGTMVVLRNISSTTCSLQAFPQLTFADKQHQPLQIELTPDTAFLGPRVQGRHVPLGHGPVALPVSLGPGITARLALRWISGEVFDHSICVEPAQLTVGGKGAGKRVSLAAHVCGPDARGIAITSTRLSTSPQAQPCGRVAEPDGAR